MSVPRGNARKVSGTKYGSAHAGPPGGGVYYGKMDASLVRDTVAAVASAGDCIMFSATSDGGACSVRVLADGLVEKWYPNNLGDLEETLKAILAAAQAAIGT